MAFFADQLEFLLADADAGKPARKPYFAKEGGKGVAGVRIRRPQRAGDRFLGLCRGRPSQVPPRTWPTAGLAPTGTRARGRKLTATTRTDSWPGPAAPRRIDEN